MSGNETCVNDSDRMQLLYTRKNLKLQEYMEVDVSAFGEPDRTLTLYSQKDRQYVIGKYECIGAMVEQNSRGQDSFLCKDTKGIFVLKVNRGTYIVKKHK